MPKQCGRCHDCGCRMEIVSGCEEWCPRCRKYHRYQSHGWPADASDAEVSECFTSDFAGSNRYMETIIAEAVQEAAVCTPA